MPPSRDQYGLHGLASIQATQSGLIELNGEKIPPCAAIG